MNKDKTVLQAFDRFIEDHACSMAFFLNAEDHATYRQRIELMAKHMAHIVATISSEETARITAESLVCAKIPRSFHDFAFDPKSNPELARNAPGTFPEDEARMAADLLRFIDDRKTAEVALEGLRLCPPPFIEAFARQSECLAGSE